MTIILDFAKYQKAQEISAPAADTTSSEPGLTQAGDTSDAEVDAPIALHAGIRLWSVTGRILKNVVSPKKRWIPEDLPPHLQRDIGLIDYAPQIRKNLWE